MSKDVRMRGFSRRHTLDDALELLLQRCAALPTIDTPLPEALGLVLAERQTAPVNLPAFPKAAVDGYALHAAETYGASGFSPVSLALIGHSLAGRPYPHALLPGQAVRIMTGAPVPDGADAVAMAEYCEEKPGARVEISQPVYPTRHICPVGEDVRIGEPVLEPGTRLLPHQLALLAALRQASVRCYARPRVRIFTCGAELCSHLARPSLYQTVDCNTPMLEALVRQHGGIPEPLGIQPESPETLRTLLVDGHCEVVITSGATSVGEEDLLPPLLASLGELLVHGVSIKPGAPIGVGRIGPRWIFLLPGNPVAAWVGFELLVRPVLQVLQGLPARRPDPPLLAPVTRKVASNLGRTDLVRARLESGHIHPLTSGGSGVLTTLSRADGYFLIGDAQEGVEAGEMVAFYPWTLA